MKIKKISLLAILAVAVMLLVIMIAPVGAITNGELDGDNHPQVVLLIVDTDDGEGWRCSATMLTPTVVLTAGHCTSNYPYPEEITDMRVFTESDVDNGDNNYPEAGPNSVEAVSWESHPLYEIEPWWWNDVGIVILEEPGVVLEDDQYGTLPEPDAYDALKTRRGRHKTTFTAVGYGLQRINPVFVQADRVRMVSYPRLIQINVPGYTGPFSMLLSNNHSTGGTCFGDSGGPNFLGNTLEVAGITSWGANGNCAGTGGVLRTDQASVLDFVLPFLD